MYKVISGCRSCGSPRLEPFLSLGEIPLANALLDEEGLRRPEPKYPLEVGFCVECSLAQNLVTVPAEVLFGEDYPYYSSFSNTLLEHSSKSAGWLISSQGLNTDSLVVEVGSNDGYMLQYFAKEGIPVLGIDPALGPVRAAQERGISTLCDFFGNRLAARLRDEGIMADVVIANNVLAHTSDLNGFVEGIGIVLKDHGVAVIEVPYVRDLIDHCEFDTIYHEHYCYFSLTALVALLDRHGLTLNHVEHCPIHGGSLRMYVGKQVARGESVRAYLEEEEGRGMTEIGFYRDFALQVRTLGNKLVTMLRDLKESGKQIAAYGAAAKGATLLNYTGVGTDLIDFAVDRNVHKQGLYMPGGHIPISDPSRLIEEMPNYVLLLTWNLKDEILRQQIEYRRKGGKFIIPIPHPTVV
jgi:SAM-dependent methyltransferase